MIAIGSDHGGYKIKEEIKNRMKKIEFKDFGTYSEERMNYPSVAIPLAESVASGECDLGILICRTGIGMSIVANKVKGIRCALCYSKEVARLAKEHNDANIISLGADMMDVNEMEEVINVWLESKFLGEHYNDRIKMVEEYEER